MKRIIIFLFLILAFSVSAGDLELIYSEGTIELKKNSTWLEINTGDYVKENATIRIGTDSSAEFEGEYKGEAVSFSIIDKGVYNIKDVLASSLDIHDSGFLTMLGSKVDFLLNTPSSTREANMGTRGEEETEDEDWESADKYIVKGIEELEENRVNIALQNFQNALQYAIEKEKPEIYYYTGLAYYKIGLKTRALKTLIMSNPKPYEYYYNDYVLLLGSLYVFSRNYDKALQILDTINNKDLSKNDRQDLHFILGIAYLKTGNNKQARNHFKEAKNINPDTATGKNAFNFLQKMK